MSRTDTGDEESVVSTEAGQASTLRGWPGLLLAFAVLIGAVYSFSPRTPPPFPDTKIYPNRVLATGLTQQGSRLCAVGENGLILTADDPKGPWSVAKVEPQRGSTLTQVLFVDDNVAVAVGHDSWILRSADRGASWKEVGFDAEKSEPLLGVAGPYGGKLFAFGVFGQYLTSTDGGQTWTREATGEDGHVALRDRHLNAMTQGPDGALLMVGERGLLARSVDNGATWQALPEIYPGSFYGALTLPDGAWLAFGMRGHVFRSTDSGSTWQRSPTPVTLSMFGGAVTPAGDVVLVGASDAVLLSRDGGLTFTLALQEDRRALADVVPLADGSLLMAGERGVDARSLSRASGGAS